MAIHDPGTARLNAVAGLTAAVFSARAWAFVPTGSGPGASQFKNVWGRDTNAIEMYNPAGTVRWAIGTNTTDYGGANVVFDTWTPLHYTRDGSNIHRLYVGGVLSVTSAADTNAGTGYAFGSYGPTSPPDFIGDIAHAAIWDNIVLTAAEIEADVARLRPRITTGLYAYYPFETVTANAHLVDMSGNAHALTAPAGAFTDATASAPARVRRGRTRRVISASSPVITGARPRTLFQGPSVAVQRAAYW